MKFTPLDIQRREFETAFRGLEAGEVRAFLHEVAAEWEEVLQENHRLRSEVLDARERLRQYSDQDRIFRETLLQAQRTKEDLLESASREKDLILKEAQFHGEELVRQAQNQVAELEAQIRHLKLERARYLQELDALLDRTRRYLQQEAPEMFPPANVTRKLDDLDFTILDHPVPPKASPTSNGL